MSEIDPLIDRRTFLRLGLAGALALTIASCGSNENDINDQVGEPTPSVVNEYAEVSDELRQNLSPEQVAEAVDAVKEWSEFYGYNEEVQLGWLEPYKAKEGRIPGTVVEDAKSGGIRISNQANIRDIVLHGMTHAIRPEQKKVLDQPLPYKLGAVTGFLGLLLGLEGKDGQPFHYVYFEEAMAERNAAILGGYTSQNRSYFAIGNLALEKVPYDLYPQAHTWVANNDVPSFVRAHLGLASSEEVTGDHIYEVMKLYKEAIDLSQGK